MVMFVCSIAASHSSGTTQTQPVCLPGPRQICQRGWLHWRTSSGCRIPGHSCPGCLSAGKPRRSWMCTARCTMCWRAAGHTSRCCRAAAAARPAQETPCGRPTQPAVHLVVQSKELISYCMRIQDRIWYVDVTLQVLRRKPSAGDNLKSSRLPQFESATVGHLSNRCSAGRGRQAKASGRGCPTATAGRRSGCCC